MSFKKIDLETLDAIKKSEYFDASWYGKTYLQGDTDPQKALEHYISLGAEQGNDPSEKFSTSGYLKTYLDIKKAGLNPLAHFIKSGKKEGRSPKGLEVTKGVKSRLPRFGKGEYGKIEKWLSFDSLTKGLNVSPKICVHLHLFHVDMLDYYTQYLKNIGYAFTLLVSVCDKDELAIKEKLSIDLPNTDNVIVRNVPNRGRDVASWVVYFAEEIKKHEIFCHIHSKKSDYNAEYSGWRQFLIHNIMGSKSVVEQIISLLVGNENIGLIMPPYFSALPNQPKWGGNYQRTYQLLKSLGYAIHSISENQCPDFPAGSFFWCKVSTIKPLLSCGISYDDFEEEAGQLDNTLGHAIERVLGILPLVQNQKAIMVGVDVAYNLTHYWDKKRYASIDDNSNLANDVNKIRYKPQISDKKIAVVTCVTGGFDELVPHICYEKGVDYYLITDDLKKPENIPEPYIWLPSRYVGINSRRTARFIKTHLHLYVGSYDYVVWIDANIMLTKPVIGQMVADLIKSEKLLGVIAHPIRTDWKSEAEECLRIGADEAEVLQEQIQFYDDLNIPKTGLIESNVWVADLKDSKVITFFSAWWQQIAMFSLRDQVSINKSLIDSEIDVHYILPKGLSVRDGNGFVIFAHDMKDERKYIRMRYFNEV